METRNQPSGRIGGSPAIPFRSLLGDSFRFWETRRFIYNLVLSAVVVVWVVASWPHFRPMFTLHSLLPLAVLASIANACYCAAYLIDIPIQQSSLKPVWKRYRWMLWMLGMLLAILLTNYWIADEIYPFVQ